MERRRDVAPHLLWDEKSYALPDLFCGEIIPSAHTEITMDSIYCNSSDFVMVATQFPNIFLDPDPDPDPPPPPPVQSIRHPKSPPRISTKKKRRCHLADCETGQEEEIDLNESPRDSITEEESSITKDRSHLGEKSYILLPEESVWELSEPTYDESELIELNSEEMEKFMDDPAVKKNVAALALVKRARKKIRNRESARISRERAKLRLAYLEKEISRLKIVNQR